MAASFDVDVASTTIRIAEGTLLPTVTLQGSASRANETDQTLGTRKTDQASVGAQRAMQESG
jgi:outer membrane protein